MLIVDEKNSGSRLDQCLAKLIPDYSRAYFQKLIKDGRVSLNGKACKVPRTHVELDAQIEIDFPEEKKIELVAENIDLPVLYEDEEIIVINKPAGIVVHPAAGNWTGTVVNALLGRNDEFVGDLSEGDLRPGIVHRLDKDTSGCLVVAKTKQSQFQLSKAFADRKVKKTYLALSCGFPKEDTERINTLIARHHVNRKKMAVVDRNGKMAITVYRVIKKGKLGSNPVSLLEVNILTGRTHQIRVHLADRNIPILGDSVYGGRQNISCARQMLHAWKLSFPHPKTGEMMEFESPWPDDFNEILDRLEKL